MALPWSEANLSSSIASLLKLEEALKCSRCHEIPSRREDGNRSVKTGLCGHSICGDGCTKIKLHSDGDFRNNDATKCPAIGCNTFLRDFVDDKAEVDRIEALAGLKAILCPATPVETTELMKSSSSENEAKPWEFMEPTQEPFAKSPVKKKRAKRSKKPMQLPIDSQTSISTVGDEYVPSSIPTDGDDFEPAVNVSSKKKPQKKKLPQQTAVSSKENKPANDEKIKQIKRPTASINKKNKRGETALHCACLKLDFGQAELLIKEGANPNTQDHNGWTPLHEVAQKKHLDLVRLLLDAGANPNIPGGDENYTPLHEAVEVGSIDIVEILVERGANKEARTISGKTPDLLTSSERVLEALKMDSEVTNSQLETTISSTTSLVPQMILLNPDPSISKNQDKMKALKQWEKKFKDGCLKERQTCAVKIELKKIKLSQSLTHFVVDDVNSDNPINEDSSYSTALFEALLMGAWILSYRWITDCLKEGKILYEGNYTVNTERNNFFKVSKDALDSYRTNANRQLPRLLQGMNIYLHGSFQNPYPNKHELTTIVEKGGAKILKREPDPSSIALYERTYPYHSNADGPLSKCSHYILYQEGQQSIGKQLVKYNMEHLKAVSVEWLFECFNSCTLIDLEDFVRNSGLDRKYEEEKKPVQSTTPTPKHPKNDEKRSNVKTCSTGRAKRMLYVKKTMEDIDSSLSDSF